MTLTERYRDPDRVVITAHRGCSGRYPENTMPAFVAAIELGVDLLELDLRGTADGIPVVLHDATIDRTSNGNGSPHEYTLAQLRELTFSYWQGAHHDGRRLERPAPPAPTIPTFEEVLQLAAGRVGLNIQLKETPPALLQAICDLYARFDQYDRGYLTVDTFADAQAVRVIDRDIEVCVLEARAPFDPAAIAALRELGCRFAQPRHADITPQVCAASRAAGIHLNVFYANTDADNRSLIAAGGRGILTDYPDRLRQTLTDLGMAVPAAGSG